MELLEYQAKKLFCEVGIPVLPSQCINSPANIKTLEIPYPVVLKSQVPKGGRAQAGGIRCVENTIDAVAAARAVFNLPILGQYPQVLLAEVRYDAQQELYLAVILDYALGRPVLLGSCRGGVNGKAVRENMQRVTVEEKFSHFYARRLAVKMGLRGELIKSVSGIIQKMYQLFVQKDLDLIEINPLGISAAGEAMALDGKITVNEFALGRHSELTDLALNNGNGNGSTNQQLPRPKLTELNWTETGGNIGIICNSNCLAATTLDLVYKAEGRPAKCLIVEDYASWDKPSLFSPVQQLQTALEILWETKGLQVIIVNIFSNSTASEEVAEVIANCLLALVEEKLPLPTEEEEQLVTNAVASSGRKSSKTSGSTKRKKKPLVQLPQFVIRLVGGKCDSAKSRLADIPVHWIDELDQTIEKAISLAPSTVSSS